MTMKFIWSFLLCAAVLPDFIAAESGIPVFEVKQIEEIRAAEGQEIRVRGLVERTGKSKGSGMNFLNFTGGEFTVVIFGRNLKNFTEGEPADIFRGQLVEVTGKVEFYKKKPQIVVEETARIVLLDAETKKPVAAPEEEQSSGKKSPTAKDKKSEAPEPVTPAKVKVDPRLYFDDP
jgi:DNA/RNA endonuclease YhcR with UshA esterase domain